MLSSELLLDKHSVWFWGEFLKAKDHFGYLGVDGGIILKHVLK
jgi:hypothetical protein